MPRAADPPPDAFGRDEGRHVFGSVAATYADARPDYPDRVFEILRDRCGLGPASRVLEIGAGAGQATRRLAATGASIVAVEPSEALAEQLRARLATADALEVVVAAFEDAELAPSAFDLVASATAFHWLDPERAFPKITAALRPGGWLALWWNVFGDPDVPDAFHEATAQLLGGLARGPGAGVGRLEYGLDVSARIHDLSSHGFRDVEHEAIRWTLRLGATQTRRLYSTYSNIARLPEVERTRILDELERIARHAFADRVVRRIVTPVYTARR